MTLARFDVWDQRQVAFSTLGGWRNEKRQDPPIAVLIDSVTRAVPVFFVQLTRPRTESGVYFILWGCVIEESSRGTPRTYTKISLCADGSELGRRQKKITEKKSIYINLFLFFFLHHD